MFGEEPKLGPNRYSTLVRGSANTSHVRAMAVSFVAKAESAVQRKAGDRQVRPEGLQVDNVSDHRAGTTILQAEKHARKPGFACITLLSDDFGYVVQSDTSSRKN